MSLTPEQVKIVKDTVPVLKEHGETITKLFYKTMLNENPDLKSVFNATNQTNGHQPRALAASLYAYASSIDDLGALAPAVELMCQKHASLCIPREYYDTVAKYLLAAMKDVLGDAFTPEVLDAWTAAYWQLANIMIKRESEIYKASRGWTEWRDFRIARKVTESSEITSFYLSPVDELPLPRHPPGQFISIQIDVPALGHRQSRQYSISDGWNKEYYRISVKRELGVNRSDPTSAPHPGVVSNLLHDEFNVDDVIQVSHPAGAFTLDIKGNTPVILISGGIGLTPLMAMLNALAKAMSDRRVHWIHGTRKPSVQPFSEHLRYQVLTHFTFRSSVFVEELEGGEVKDKEYNFEGRVDLSKLNKEYQLFLNDEKTVYYVCGPEAFMLNIEKQLKDLSVPDERIKMERFGTGGIDGYRKC